MALALQMLGTPVLEPTIWIEVLEVAAKEPEQGPPILYFSHWYSLRPEKGPTILELNHRFAL